MASNHICADSCFDGVKLRNKRPINCFSCIKKFNPKCFNINIQLKDTDNIVFLCGKCISTFKEYSKNRKSTSRNSFNSQITSKNAQPLLHLNNIAVQPNNQCESNNVTILNDIDTRLNAILDKLTSLNKNSIAEKAEKIDINISKLTSTIDNTYNLLSKVDCKMNKMSTSEEIKSATKNICGSFAEYTETLNKNLNSGTSNELFTHNNHDSLIDWSMKIDSSINTDLRRHSIIQNCTIGDNILDVIRNHEQTTWESIDTLNRNLSAIGNDLTNKIDSNTSTLNQLCTLSNGNGGENFHVMEKLKDAIAQLNNTNKISPETSKLKQKRQMPTLSDMELESAVICKDAFNSSNESSEIIDIDATDSIDENNSQHIKKKQINNLNREFHLSKFDSTTTSDDILNYLHSKGIITDNKNIRVIALIRKNEDFSSYSFISFKIETTNEIAEVILRKNFWPSLCIIKDFIRKNTTPKITSLNNFLLKQQIATQSR